MVERQGVQTKSGLSYSARQQDAPEVEPGEEAGPDEILTIEESGLS